MSEPTRRYWFPAKRYGWGWGPPTAWQGWVFLIVWFAVMVAGAVWITPRRGLVFALFVVAMITVMVAVGYAKGEPPRWHWGDRDR
jgi:hypothetical protein